VVSGIRSKFPCRSRCSTLPPSTFTLLYPNNLRLSLGSLELIELLVFHSFLLILLLSLHLSGYFSLTSVKGVRLIDSMPLECRSPRCFGALSKTLKSDDLPKTEMSEGEGFFESLRWGAHSKTPYLPADKTLQQAATVWVRGHAARHKDEKGKATPNMKVEDL
jgi:hypothetical protein